MRSFAHSFFKRSYKLRSTKTLIIFGGSGSEKSAFTGVLSQSCSPQCFCQFALHSSSNRKPRRTIRSRNAKLFQSILRRTNCEPVSVATAGEIKSFLVGQFEGSLPA